MRFLYSCGIRLSELIGIKDGDVDFMNRTIKVLGKRNKERIIPIHHSLIEKIKDWLKIKEELFETKEAFLLITDKGEKLYPKFVYRKVNYYLGQVTSLQKKKSSRSKAHFRYTYVKTMVLN